jgi:hypothetical protein
MWDSLLGFLISFDINDVNSKDDKAYLQNFIMS